MTATAPLLSLRDLRVDVGERNVLKSVTLDVPAGALLVLMGANGSGKSTLGLTLAGHPRYKVTGGQARFGGQDLLAMNPQQRARAGLFLSFQAPPEIPGVKNNLFIRTALNAVREARGEPALDAFDFLGSARAAATRLGLPEAMLGRARSTTASRAANASATNCCSWPCCSRAWRCWTRSTRAWTSTACAPWSSWCRTCGRAARPSSWCRTTCS
jgi:Fe-S cluster assembly ATPase SufC